MQSTMNPISPVGRAVLPAMQGATPDQATARATEIAKTGLIPFDQAISMKQMADSISRSGGMMNQGPPETETVVGSLLRQIQEAMNPPAAPPAMNAGVAALPMPDDMYAGVGMAGGGIVAFSGEQGSLVTGGNATLGPYQPPPGPYQSPRRIPYEESLLGRLTTPVGEYFSRLYEEDMRRTAQRRAAAGDKSKRDWAEVFGGELPPSPLAGAANMLAAAGYGFPTTLEGLGGKPFTEPTPALRTAPSDLRPGDKAPPPALRAAPPAPTGPTAPTGIAALIPQPDQKAIQAEVDKSYGGIYDAIKRQDALLEKQGADVAKRADAQNRMILAMTGFRMAEAAGRPGATFLGSAGAAGAEYAKSRIAANEEFADRMDKLAEARSELDLATARLDVDKSDKAREIYESKNKTFLDEQARVQLLLIEQSKLSIAQEELDIARDELTAGDPAAYTRLMAIEQRAIDSLSDTPLYVDAQNMLVMARRKIQNAADISKDELSQAMIEEEAAMKTIKDLEKAARARIWNIYGAGASAGEGSNDSDTLNPEDIRRAVGD